MYKYEIGFKGGHKLEFESYLKPSEIVYVREVKQ